MSSSRRKFCGTCAAALLFILLISCTDRSSPVNRAPMLSAPNTSGPINSQSFVEVQLGTVSRTASGEGSIYFPQTRNVASTFNNARLISINVSKGDKVQEGDVIAEFEIEFSSADLQKSASNYEIASLQYRAALAVYRDNLEAAKSNLKALLAAGDAPRADISKAEIMVKKAESSLDYYIYDQTKYLQTLKNIIEGQQALIGDNKLRAPIDGVVANVEYLVVGNIIEPYTNVCTIYSADPLWLSTNLDISNGMRYNCDVEINITGQASPTKGRVVTAPDIFGASTGRVTVKPESGSINISPDDRIRRISIISQRYTLDNVMVLPSSAVHNEEGKRYVYLLEDDVLKKRYVTVGLSSQNIVQILDGLEVGQKIALT